MREAKVHTTWASVDAGYEDAVMTFIDGALDREESRAFLAAFLPFVERLATFGVRNSLVQTALKLTVPGVPDIYQGAELWDLSLMDPDNRRPVDFAARIRLLEELERNGRSMGELLGAWRDGAVKLFLTSRILALRAAQPELFAKGDYEALAATGGKAELICAFARRLGERNVVVITSRFPVRFDADPCWGDTAIPLPQSAGSGRYRNILTGTEFDATPGMLTAGSGLEGLPVAVLTQGCEPD
jgi:(1->4)-alpha-D-glucan 1-alpha-D-glucosylmutase